MVTSEQRFDERGSPQRSFVPSPLFSGRPPDERTNLCDFHGHLFSPLVLLCGAEY
jgi:hypothetical protein